VFCYFWFVSNVGISSVSPLSTKCDKVNTYLITFYKMFKIMTELIACGPAL